MAHKLKIVLNNTEPKISRTLIVPEIFTFDELHTTIQIAFGWNNCHLYEFTLGAPYSNPAIKPAHTDDDWEDENEDDLNSDETFLDEIFSEKQKNINYTYDFGDSWTHKITILAKPKTEVDFPKCIASEGPNACEDCGGPWGLNHLRILLNNKKPNNERTEMMEWLGLPPGITYEEGFEFDIEDVNVMLSEEFEII
jgi:Plasmid pRiA4b ORF-3-like protein